MWWANVTYKKLVFFYSPIRVITHEQSVNRSFDFLFHKSSFDFLFRFVFLLFFLYYSTCYAILSGSQNFLIFLDVLFFNSESIVPWLVKAIAKSFSNILGIYWVLCWFLIINRSLLECDYSLLILLCFLCVRCSKLSIWEWESFITKKLLTHLDLYKSKISLQDGGDVTW